MGVGALLPALGGILAAETIGPAIGTAIGSMLPAQALGLGAGAEALVGAVPMAASTIPVAGATIPASSLMGISTGTIGKGIAGLGGSAIGGLLSKAAIPTDAGGAVQAATPPGIGSFPNARGVEGPQFQFQTVGTNPSAVIGARGGGDLTELLKRFAT